MGHADGDRHEGEENSCSLNVCHLHTRPLFNTAVAETERPMTYTYPETPPIWDCRHQVQGQNTGCLRKGSPAHPSPRVTFTTG